MTAAGLKMSNGAIKDVIDDADAGNPLQDESLGIRRRFDTSDANMSNISPESGSGSEGAHERFSSPETDILAAFTSIQAGDVPVGKVNKDVNEPPRDDGAAGSHHTSSTPQANNKSTHPLTPFVSAGSTVRHPPSSTDAPNLGDAERDYYPTAPLQSISEDAEEEETAASLLADLTGLAVSPKPKGSSANTSQSDALLDILSPLAERQQSSSLSTNDVAAETSSSPSIAPPRDARPAPAVSFVNGYPSSPINISDSTIANETSINSDAGAQSTGRMSFVERLASVQEDDEMHVATQGSRARVDRSIASLVGPGALPYARNPSGVDAYAFSRNKPNDHRKVEDPSAKTTLDPRARVFTSPAKPSSTGVSKQLTFEKPSSNGRANVRSEKKRNQIAKREETRKSDVNSQAAKRLTHSLKQSITASSRQLPKSTSAPSNLSAGFASGSHRDAGNTSRTEIGPEGFASALLIAAEKQKLTASTVDSVDFPTLADSAVISAQQSKKKGTKKTKPARAASTGPSLPVPTSPVQNLGFAGQGSSPHQYSPEQLASWSGAYAGPIQKQQAWFTSPTNSDGTSPPIFQQPFMQPGLAASVLPQQPHVMPAFDPYTGLPIHGPASPFLMNSVANAAPIGLTPEQLSLLNEVQNLKHTNQLLHNAIQMMNRAQFCPDPVKGITSTPGYFFATAGQSIVAAQRHREAFAQDHDRLFSDLPHPAAIAEIPLHQQQPAHWSHNAYTEPGPISASAHPFEAFPRAWSEKPADSHRLNRRPVHYPASALLAMYPGGDHSPKDGKNTLSMVGDWITRTHEAPSGSSDLLPPRPVKPALQANLVGVVPCSAEQFDCSMRERGQDFDGRRSFNTRQKAGKPTPKRASDLQRRERATAPSPEVHRAAAILKPLDANTSHVSNVETAKKGATYAASVVKGPTSGLKPIAQAVNAVIAKSTGAPIASDDEVKGGANRHRNAAASQQWEALKQSTGSAMTKKSKIRK